MEGSYVHIMNIEGYARKITEDSSESIVRGWEKNTWGSCKSQQIRGVDILKAMYPFIDLQYRR